MASTGGTVRVRATGSVGRRATAGESWGADRRTCRFGRCETAAMFARRTKRGDDREGRIGGGSCPAVVEPENSRIANTEGGPIRGKDVANNAIGKTADVSVLAATDGVTKLDRPRGTSSTSQAMANSVNILLGVGLLSVPYALKEGGWAGLGVLTLLGLMTNYTGKVLIRCQQEGSLPALNAGSGGARDGKEEVQAEGARRPLMSYEDIGEAAFGPSGRTFITWVLYTELIGTCALFFILEGDHLAILLNDAFSSETLMAVSAAVMIPTLWLADLSSLSYVGALGAMASVSLMGVVLFELFASPGFPAQLPAAFETTAALHLSTLPLSFGLLAFVFAGHAVFPAIYTSMEQPEEYEPMLDKTYAIVGVTCLLIGTAGYMLYGDAVKDEVTINLPEGIASTLALALITVNPFSKFALTMDPVSRGLEEALGVDIAAKEGNGPLIARGMRTGLGLGALTMAAKVPFFAVVMSLIGSFLTLTVSVIFPSACYLKMFEDDISDGERAVNWAIMVVGGFGVVAGTYAALADIIGR